MAKQVGRAGSAYAKGRISVDDVAKLLELISMSPDDQALTYQPMRVDRLSRGGGFVPTPEMISRDVIASERIGGIDARAWFACGAPTSP
ncbi:MAG: hypothetical protein WEF50_01430 [Myxococcota bacterium]